MFSERRLHHIVLAALGTIIFFVGAFAGFGWAVWKRANWIERLFYGEKEERLWNFYAGFASGIAPWDSDGDGYGDGLELFMESDPKNAAIRPDVGSLPCRYEWGTPFCDEWCHRWYRPSIDEFLARWVPGTRFTVSASDPAIVLRPMYGGPESTSLTIAANADGELPLDVCFRSPVGENLPNSQRARLSFVDPKSGDTFSGDLQEVFGWRGPTIPATIFDDYGHPRQPDRNFNNFFQRPPDWEKAAWYLLEARRKKPGQHFRGRQVLSPDGDPGWIFLTSWVDDGTWLDDYDWQITTALKAPPAARPPAK